VCFVCVHVCVCVCACVCVCVGACVYVCLVCLCVCSSSIKTNFTGSLALPVRVLVLPMQSPLHLTVGVAIANIIGV
jgi:hypothetical protein